jgi:hypothetical protein
MTFLCMLESFLRIRIPGFCCAPGDIGARLERQRHHGSQRTSRVEPLHLLEYVAFDLIDLDQPTTRKTIRAPIKRNHSRGKPCYLSGDLE